MWTHAYLRVDMQRTSVCVETEDGDNMTWGHREAEVDPGIVIMRLLGLLWYRRQTSPCNQNVRGLVRISQEKRRTQLYLARSCERE